MDYKYINQLLERYWRCETSLEEEDILRAFFSQADIPADLKRYQPLFAYQREEPKVDVLGDDFDEKILAMTEEPKVVKARIVSMPQRLRPLFKAAAIVAIALTIGRATEHAIGEHEAEEKNVIAVDTYIKTKDAQQMIRVKDESQAEMKTSCDTILNVANSASDGI